MLKAIWMLSLIVGVLLSAVCLADDAPVSAQTAKAEPVPKISLEKLLAAPKYVPRWKPIPGAQSSQLFDDWPDPIAEVEFQDSSILGRLSRLRSLSLLTLTENENTWLFLGVNEKGYLGLHYGAHPEQVEESNLQFVPLPRLPKFAPDGEADWPR